MKERRMYVFAIVLIASLFLSAIGYGIVTGSEGVIPSLNATQWLGNFSNNYLGGNFTSRVRVPTMQSDIYCIGLSGCLSNITANSTQVIISAG